MRSRGLAFLFALMLSLAALADEVSDAAAPNSAEVAPQELSIEVRGLFPGMAILIVNGEQRNLKQGRTSPEGITLIKANSKEALVDINGKRRTLTLTHAIGANYSVATKSEVRLASHANGHYFGNAIINGKNVQFVIDTGATAVTMNSTLAKIIGIDLARAQTTRVATAQGVTVGHTVMLSKVTVGSITVDNVSAIVIDGEYPVDMLLGNTFLSKVEMKVESGVLVLEANN